MPEVDDNYVSSIYKLEIKTNLYQAEQDYVRGELVRNCRIHDLDGLTEEKTVLLVYYKVENLNLKNKCPRTPNCIVLAKMSLQG